MDDRDLVMMTPEGWVAYKAQVAQIVADRNKLYAAMEDIAEGIVDDPVQFAHHLINP